MGINVWLFRGGLQVIGSLGFYGAVLGGYSLGVRVCGLWVVGGLRFHGSNLGVFDLRVRVV